MFASGFRDQSIFYILVAINMIIFRTHCTMVLPSQCVAKVQWTEFADGTIGNYERVIQGQGHDFILADAIITNFKNSKVGTRHCLRQISLKSSSSRRGTLFFNLFFN
jgi:hypothetical protein